MKRRDGGPLRIAHRFGNTREKIDEALASDVDLLEADVWYRGGRLWVRHEHRLGPLPILADRRPPPGQEMGRWAVKVPPRHFLRPDLKPLDLPELLRRVGGRRPLLIDVKTEGPPKDSAAFAAALARDLEAAGCEDAIVCGQAHGTLDHVRAAAAGLPLCYSLENEAQWRDLRERVEGGEEFAGVCIYHRMLTAERAEYLRSGGVPTYCWTVDDPERARSLVERGADGIISNSLSLLEELAGAKAPGGDAGSSAPPSP